MAARVGGRVGGVNYAWSPTYVAIGAVPALSAVTNPIVSGVAFAISGSNFESAQGAGFARLVQSPTTLELTESAWADGSISCAAVDVFATTLRFGSITALVQNNTGNSGTFDTTLIPPANVGYFSLLAVNTTAALRIEATTPNLSIGEQIAYQNQLYTDSNCTTPASPARSVTPDAELDGAFSIDGATPNGTYYFRAWRRRADTGAWENAVQTVVVAVAITGSGSSIESGGDTSAGYGAVANTGSGASTESAGDSSSGSGAPIVTGSGSSSESGQDVSGGNIAVVTGSGASTEGASDSSSGAGPGGAAAPTNLPFATGARYMTVKVMDRGGRPIRQAKYIHEQLIGEQLVYSVDFVNYLAQSGLSFNSFVSTIAAGDSMEIIANELVGSVASVLLRATSEGTTLIQITASLGVETDIFTFEIDSFGPADE